jgi:glycosyltransferase involved in cell wall biosynthesis
MKRYRLPFFTGLHSALRQEDIELIVAYSDPNSEHAARRDSAELPEELGHKVEGYWFTNRFVYQPLWREIRRADLVIVGPENKYLINPLLLVLSVLRLKTVAFWGLGPNMHPDRSEISEWIKERVLTSVDWWFAYTDTITSYLREYGMPAERITTVQNATDTCELRRLMGDIDDEEVARAKVDLTGSRASRIGFYCGLLGKIKSLPLLVESARRVKLRVPEFHLVIVGNGPDRSWLEQAIANEPWIHYMGSRYGRDSALLYKMADIFLLAGTAGLAIVDSFAAGLPLFATSLPTHPPEVSYLRDGENGRMTAHNAEAYAEAIVEVLTKPELMGRLRRGATEAGSKYTMEAMVENFRMGIKQCLTRCDRAPVHRGTDEKATSNRVKQRGSAGAVSQTNI